VRVKHDALAFIATRGMLGTARFKTNGAYCHFFNFRLAQLFLFARVAIITRTRRGNVC
jgi:hypothetical protein